MNSRKLERSVSIASSKSTGTTAAKIVQPIETFHDLHDAIDKLEEDLLGDVTSRSTDIKPNPTLGELLHMNITYGNQIYLCTKLIYNFLLNCHCKNFIDRQNTTSLDRFHMQINAHEMYPENSNVDQLLNDMATLPIHKVGEYTIYFIAKFDIECVREFIRLKDQKRYEYECLYFHRGDACRNTVQNDYNLR